MAQPGPLAPEGSDARPKTTVLNIWIPDVLGRIAGFLSSNDIACSLRPVNKATAAQFHHNTIIRLSQPAPHYAFAARWGSARAFRPYPFKLRCRLLCLVAASGVLANLELAARFAGCVLQDRVLAAAAAAGELQMCARLRELGCPWSKPVLADAAFGGHLALCAWLLAAGCPWHAEAVYAAARGGHAQLVEWLIARSPQSQSQTSLPVRSHTHLPGAQAHLPGAQAHPQRGEAASWQCLPDAAPALTHPPGQSALVPPQEPQQPPQQPRHHPHHTDRRDMVNPAELAEAAAEGCDLATLQRLHQAWLEAAAASEVGLRRTAAAATAAATFGHAGPAPPPHPHHQPHHRPHLPQHQRQQQLLVSAAAHGTLILAAAAASPTPDWRAKVEWLEGQGHPRTSRATCRAAALPDALTRLAWLRRRGYPVDDGAVSQAARAGNAAALSYLLTEAAVRVDSWVPAALAAIRGHMAVLQVLHARGCVAHHVAQYAADGGHLGVMTWLVKALRVNWAPGVPASPGSASPGSAAGGRVGYGVFQSAAASGNVALMTWLYERGRPPLDEQVLYNAALSGCEEALEWLVERGCPAADHGSAYKVAATRGDLATLQCLHRLGCPSGDADSLFAEVAGRGDLVTLRCLRGLLPGWRPRSAALTAWVIRGCPLPSLRWLVEEAGCPVDWAAAVEAAEQLRRRQGPEEDAAAWLRAEQSRRGQGNGV